MKIEDYEAVMIIWKNIEGMGLSTADSYEKIKTFLNRNKKLSYVFIENEQIVGTILCGQDGRRGYIYHLAVNEMYRRKKIGSTLIETSLKNLEKLGINKCHLFVFEKNELGKRFYENADWKYRSDVLVFSKKM